MSLWFFGTVVQPTYVALEFLAKWGIALLVGMLALVLLAGWGIAHWLWHRDRKD